MAVSRALRRLLRIRNLEEELRRLALDSAVAEMRRLEHALVLSGQRNRRGRALVVASAHNGQFEDRIAGVEETRLAIRHAEVLTPLVADMELEVAALRQEFLAKRVERRQAETLIDETEAREAVTAGRRAQQQIDDWYSSRLKKEHSSDEQDRKT
jgi:hypothetical protein